MGLLQSGCVSSRSFGSFANTLKFVFFKPIELYHGDHIYTAVLLVVSALYWVPSHTFLILQSSARRTSYANWCRYLDVSKEEVPPVPCSTIYPHWGRFMTILITTSSVHIIYILHIYVCVVVDRSSRWHIINADSHDKFSVFNSFGKKPPDWLKT